VDHEKISQWTGLLNLIRMNVELTGKVQAPNQLFVAFETVVLVTEVLFLAVSSVMGGVFKTNLIVSIFVGSSYFHRLICKILAAERLSQQVKLNFQFVGTSLISTNGH